VPSSSLVSERGCSGLHVPSREGLLAQGRALGLPSREGLLTQGRTLGLQSREGCLRRAGRWACHGAVLLGCGGPQTISSFSRERRRGLSCPPAAGGRRCSKLPVSRFVCTPRNECCHKICTRDGASSWAFRTLANQALFGETASVFLQCFAKFFTKFIGFCTKFTLCCTSSTHCRGGPTKQPHLWH
jgi:hypothetical protein